MVFFVGFNLDINDEADKDRFNVVYTAISRARGKLYVTSAHPKQDLEKIFKSGTYKLMDSQKPIVKKYKQLKKIKENRNFTFNNVNMSMIDSVVIKVSMKDAPFAKYVKNGFVPKKYMDQFKWQNMYSDDSNPVNVRVTQHHAHGTYKFEFFDLNMLHKNGYTDSDILMYLSNYVMEFFDYRVREKDMKIHRIDLCKYFRFDNAEDHREFNEFLCEYILYSKAVTVLDSDFKTNRIVYNIFEDKKPDLYKGTVYANHNKKKQDGITTSIYMPSKKDNHNKIFFENVTKIEIRLLGSSIGRRYALKKSDNIAGLKSVRLGNVFDRLFGKYFPDIERFIQRQPKYWGLKKLRGFDVFGNMFNNEAV